MISKKRQSPNEKGQIKIYKTQETKNLTTRTTLKLGVKNELEDTKGVIRIRKAKKNRQHNDQKKKRQKDKQRSRKHCT